MESVDVRTNVNEAYELTMQSEVRGIEGGGLAEGREEEEEQKYVLMHPPAQPEADVDDVYEYIS